MAVAALALFVLLMVLVAVVPPRNPRPADAFSSKAHWLSWLWFYGMVTTGAVAPVTALLSAEPLLDDTRVEVAGLILAVAGISATVGAKLAMGDSWRVGPDSDDDSDSDERVALVTSGPFRLVRNPYLTSLTATGIGLTLMVPTVQAILGLILVVVGVRLLTRRVEEPHLLRVHGEDYRRYARITGRFVPWLGHLR